MDRTTSASLCAITFLMSLIGSQIADGLNSLGAMVAVTSLVLAVGFALHALVFYKSLNKGI